MINVSAEYGPALVVRIGHEDIEIRSIGCAIALIRSLRHDHLGNYAEMLLAQLEAADTPAQQAEAWRAFETWSMACGLLPDSHARRAA
ncbi:hypothetical protein [Ancylobacter lacus]|uniref:hypothetical protein n=1 Tax=Ancylobacter lacus TaxID=2579970 RepID=UPI001BCCE508|nr:hypothetical protein [Ancylobacter lacus]MBS7539830.1 hypothetical protein [Ancylobacter lacus]